jgi:uncharacterized repeat protein (TIGR01451 family)
VSYWTYKFFTDCVPGTAVSAISTILIPICSTITPAQVTVELKVDTCGTFTPLVFGENNDWFLTTNDGNFGTAPTGFQWLKILNNGSYDKGVCVTYRIGISGNVTPVTQAIRIKAGTNLITACGTNPCFLVPGCAATPGVLSVNKTCTVTYANNMAVIHYRVTVTNTGGTTLNNVSFTDTITYNPAL